ncbi:MAG: nuclear transport factor 2 family protein [Burkholderiales bacterium]|nr:nuclear transport factor 2 family protein [Burkholderiales bacterium]
MTTPQDILALENRRYQAMVAADVAVLNELLADDLIYTHSNAVIDTKQSYIDGIVGKRWHYTKAERPEERIEVFGDCARVTGHIRLTLGNPDGSSRTVNGRFLNLWLRRNGKWQLAAWQSTPIPA